MWYLRVRIHLEYLAWCVLNGFFFLLPFLFLLCMLHLANKNEVVIQLSREISRNRLSDTVDNYISLLIVIAIISQNKK